MTPTTPTGTTEDESRSLLDQLIGCIEKRVSDKRLAAMCVFARAYARRADAADAADPEQFCSEVIGAFELADRRGTKPAIVRAFTPTLVDDGYETTGSVLETNCLDSPFLVDSATLAITRAGYEVRDVVHPIIGVERDARGHIAAVMPARESDTRESLMHFGLAEALSGVERETLADRVRAVLADVQAAVRDYAQMQLRVDDMIEAARGSGPFHDAGETDEVAAFLDWLRADNFIFLGFREYSLEGDRLRTVKGAGLGILSNDEISSYAEPVPLTDTSPALRSRLLGGNLLVVSKTNSFSTVHRQGRLDDITIVATGPYGNTVGALRMLGLFTSKAYTAAVGKVPILRHKLHQIATLEDFLEGSHDYKRLVETFESFPMDELYAATVDELRPLVVDLLGMQEERLVRVLLRPDLGEGRVAVMVIVPRDRFSGELRKRVEAMLYERLGGTSVDYHLAISEASEARMHFTIYVPGEMPDVSLNDLERTVVQMTRTWDDLLHERLDAVHGGAKAAALATRYGEALPDSYKSATDVEQALVDVEHFEQLSASSEFTVGLRNQRTHERDLTRIGLYKTGGKVRLSDFLPILENLGFSVVEEVPTHLRDGAEGMYLHDIGVLGIDDRPLALADCGERAADAISAVWAGSAISDSLNRLVITGGLTWQQVTVLRAYRTYRQRLGVPFTAEYENDAFARNADIARRLIEFFELRLDPNRPREPQTEDSHRSELLEALDAVVSLDEDRILRAYLGLIEATLRTNAFLPNREYVSFKLASHEVPNMPEPKPLYEIFVQSPHMEGIHLRGGAIARGGIRWSDRKEDYRTEILGLMKTQMIKNVVIVPVGSKGGFVLRDTPVDRDELRAAVRTQYRVLIRGMLDLTDNRVGDAVVRPDGVVVRDDDDPYLVVAADRGTATFSDVANEIADEYGFWLDDAFASGGSIGYDHKELGITARGAWECVERHFREIGIDFEADAHTAVGIGDMSGDVFGNGLLYSEKTKLVAAFDHRHIFIDPDPDLATSFAERKRLFELPRSSWADYDTATLSEGGGVWGRAEKRIVLAPEARAALALDGVDELTPNDLVSAILSAPVDLLWNGGIGTFVKGTSETHLEVGDRANDAVRVDGADVRARVVGEGGNLGLTQQGRIEFAQSGGHLNIDAIDNSAGVDCSDHEVNLKILLGIAVEDGELSREQRNRLLRDVEDEVADLVIYDNYLQAQIVSQEMAVSSERLEAYDDLMLALEARGMLDRQLETLPTSEQIAERIRADSAMVRPELCVLLSYAKWSLEEELRGTELLDDPLFEASLLAYFPKRIQEGFVHTIQRHPLRRELLSTIVANAVVNAQGITFASRLALETGASLSEVVRAYWIARSITGASARWASVEVLDGQLDPAIQNVLMVGVDTLVEDVTRWYVSNDVERSAAEVYAAAEPSFRELVTVIDEAGSDAWRERRERLAGDLVRLGVEPELASTHVHQDALVHAPAILAVAAETKQTLYDTAQAFFRAGEELRIDWLERRLAILEADDRFERLALRAIQDNLRALRRAVAAGALAGEGTVAERIDSYTAQRQVGLERLDRLIEAEPDAAEPTLAELTVFLGQLRSIVG